MGPRRAGSTLVQPDSAFAIAPLDDAPQRANLHSTALESLQNPRRISAQRCVGCTRAPRSRRSRSACYAERTTTSTRQRRGSRFARRTAPVLVDAYVSAFMFAAWSTIETSVFAANALGYAIDPSGFRTLIDAKSLRDISPDDVLITSKKYRAASLRRARASGSGC